MTIAILGTGLLGTGFARALRRKGEDVRVWNRTAERARPLAADGIAVADRAADAVRGAVRVHLTLADDAAVDAVLEAAAPGLVPGALAVDHSTTSPGGAAVRTRTWRERGIAFLHAPVFMGPQNALDSTGFMMVSGDPAVIDKARPALAAMTGKLLELGPRVEAAACYKLIGNLLLMAIAAGFMDMLSLARSMGMGAPDIAALLAQFNPGTQLPARFARLASADYDQPSWELAMARKDARLMLAEVDSAGLALVMLPRLVEAMDLAVAEGHAHRDWTVIARDLIG